MQPAFAGFVSGPEGLRSEDPCFYSLQLQKSVAERKRYLVKLNQATGGAVARTSAVEDMYSNITPASYSAEEDATDGGWGLGTKTVNRELAGVDALSLDCIGCHDGASAIAVDASSRNNPYGSPDNHTGSVGNDHPIGMDYQRYVTFNGKKFKPIFGLATKMVFVDGKVGCLTCHDPLNPERGHLVMSDKKSALCLTCHDK
jgi:predicted CXXCH cytochrome family protein